jgi:predicted nucleic acid-binding protein
LNPCVLDTSVASLIFKNSPLAVRYRSHLTGATPILSFQTIAEMRFGALLAYWGAKRRQTLERFLSNDAIILYSDELATHWAQIMHEARKAGRRLGTGDAWIAATARHLNAPLFTHDKDFSIEAVSSLTVYRYIDISETEHP